MAIVENKFFSSLSFPSPLRGEGLGERVRDVTNKEKVRLELNNF